MPNHSSRAIANEFIKRANNEGEPLTHMQLQKLIYIAHGWNLAVNGSPLIDEQPRAWEYGPVYQSLYRALNSHGAAPVKQRIRVAGGEFSDDGKSKPMSADLSDEERAVLNRVYVDYGHYPAFQLSALTHADGTPWHNTYHSKGRNSQIDNQSIRDHFVEIAQGASH